MARYCPCGKPISNKRRICIECGSIYGYIPSEWPEWLRLIVNDINREELECRRHDHLNIDTDIEPNGCGGYRPKKEIALRGCRTETHLYEDRHKHGG